MKNILIFLLCVNLFADISIPNTSKQLLVVTSTDFNTSHALLQAYEYKNKQWIKVFLPIKVNIGTKGLAWGRGEHTLPKDALMKKEGDKKAPAGLFTLDSFFTYEDLNFIFPSLTLQKEHLCIDDSASKDYNKIIYTQNKDFYKSYETMKREDNLYELGIVVGHNKEAFKEGGSCIFIHIQRGENSSTAGCTSMKKEKLLVLMKWLDYSKHPMLLQGVNIKWH